MASIGLYAEIACIWEVSARKPGNVHRCQDFADGRFVDFLVSAAALAPVLELACQRSLGETVLEAVKARRRLVATNTNLGIVLLLAPLAAVPAGADLRSGLERNLARLDVSDSRAVYEAIRLAQAGGLGNVGDQDIQNQPTLPLRQIMTLAADRDMVARQYSNGFHEVFDEGVPILRRALEKTGCLESAIIGTYLHLLAKYPDSLISRKRGRIESEEVSRRAHGVIEAGWPHSSPGQQALADLDTWLRAEGNARNPGTTADLVTASLFVALRQGIIPLPAPWPW